MPLGQQVAPLRFAAVSLTMDPYVKKRAGNHFFLDPVFSVKICGTTTFLYIVELGVSTLG